MQSESRLAGAWSRRGFHLAGMSSPDSAPCSRPRLPLARSLSLFFLWIYLATSWSVVVANESTDAARNDVIEGGISVEKCAESNVLGLYSGAFLLPDVYKVEDSMYRCCERCVEASECAAWDYCTRAKGCKPPGGLVKQQSPLQREGAETGISVNGTSSSFEVIPVDASADNSTLPYGACVLTSRLLSADLAATKEDGGSGARFGFFSGTVERLFLPYLNGFTVTEGKDIAEEYDFSCGYSPRKLRCEILGTIPEVAAICSADPRCKGFVYSQTEGLGVLKGGEGAYLFTDEELYNSDGVVYALTREGQLGVVVDPETSSSSNLWIILISVLGGVAILSIAAVIITMYVLSQRYDKLKSSESYLQHLHEGRDPPDFNCVNFVDVGDGVKGVDGANDRNDINDGAANGQVVTGAGGRQDVEVGSETTNP